MEIFSSYDLIIEISLIIIASFFFSELARKTNIPSVSMLIVLGIGLGYILEAYVGEKPDFFPVLEVLGIVGLIMIVLEAALELELKREKLWPILKALLIALIGLLASTWVAALILNYFISGMSMELAWLYATPLSILSSAIIIPSVTGLSSHKKEFHIYESTFSDILGIMLFYFLLGPLEHADHSSGLSGFFQNLGLTIAISVIASYLIVLVFQQIKSHVKLFLMIAILLLLYALGKQMHLSSLLIILIFGLVIANIPIFFQGRLAKLIHKEQTKELYDGLHIITMETAFVVRTFFFVIFGLTITLSSIWNIQVAIVSGLIILSIYIIRFIMLRIMIGKDINPQIYIAPRGLITILLFYAIPEKIRVQEFESGILLFIIIVTSLVMTFAMISDKQRTSKAIRQAKDNPVGYIPWKAPSITAVKDENPPNKH